MNLKNSFCNLFNWTLKINWFKASKLAVAVYDIVCKETEGVKATYADEFKTFLHLKYLRCSQVSSSRGGGQIEFKDKLIHHPQYFIRTS